MVFIARVNRNALMRDKTNKDGPKDGAPRDTGADPKDVQAIEQAALSRVAAGRTGKRDAATMKLSPAFDSWLEGKLHKIFDTASTEPLPQDLMNLLVKIDQAEAAQQNKDGKKE